MSIRTTVYSRVAETLRDRILSGHWQPGQQLPTERQLCEDFEASRITIRRALQILEQEMLVIRRQGSGTYVSPTPVRKIPLLTTDFAGSMSVHAPDVERRLEWWEWAEATDEEAAALHVSMGARVLRASRTDRLGGMPVAVDVCTLVAAFADLLGEENLRQLDFMDSWQHAQDVRLSYVTQAIEAVAAELPFSEGLGVALGQPVLKETNVCFTEGGRAAGSFVTWYRPDSFRFEATIDVRSHQVRLGERPMAGAPANR